MWDVWIDKHFLSNYIIINCAGPKYIRSTTTVCERYTKFYPATSYINPKQNQKKKSSRTNDIF